MKFVDIPEPNRIERDPDNRIIILADGKIKQSDVVINQIELLQYKTKIDSGSSTLKFNLSDNLNHRIVKSNLFPITELQINTISFQQFINDNCNKELNFINPY